MAIEERDLTTTETTMLRASCNRKALLKALTAVKGTVTTRCPLPICTAVKLTADNGTLTLTATNLDAAMVYDVPAQMPNSGECVADFKPLFNAVKTLKSTTVELSHDGKALTVDGGRQIIPVNARWDVADFPVMPSTFDGQSFMLDSAELATIAASTAPFAADDDTRPVLTGALFRVDGDTLEVATADGFTLSTRKTANMTGDNGQFILPASTLKLFKHLPADSLAYVTLGAPHLQCEIQSKDIRIISRLIEGQYPNIRQIIPTKFEGTFTVKRSDLAEVLPMVLPAAVDSSNAVNLTVEPSDGIATLTLSAGSAEIPTVRVAVDIIANGTIPDVQFNGRYIKRMIDSMDSTHITWKISSKNSASVMVPTDGADHTVVIMPMHTAR